MTRLLAQFVQTAGRANEFSSLSVLVARVPPLVRSMMTRGRLHRGKLLSVSDIPRCRRDDRRSRRLVVNPIVSPAEMRVHVVRDRCRYGCTAVAVLEHRVSSVSNGKLGATRDTVPIFLYRPRVFVRASSHDDDVAVVPSSQVLLFSLLFFVLPRSSLA